MPHYKPTCAEACYASRLTRFLEGYCVDPLLYSVPVYAIFAYLTKHYVALNGIPEIFESLPDEIIDMYGTLTLGTLLQALALNVFSFIFLFLFEVFAKGRTPGKYMCRTVVVDINGNRPSVWRLLLRTLCRFIPFDAFSFLFGRWSGGHLFGNWHDKLSGTYVVDAKLLELWKEGKYDGSDRLSAAINIIMDEAKARANDDDADENDDTDERNDVDDTDERNSRKDDGRVSVEDLYPSEDFSSENHFDDED